jgi:hypothetical protein
MIVHRKRGVRQGFKVGDRVRLKDLEGYTAKIAGFSPDIEGGVWLDRPLAGFISWNVEDLVRVFEK